MNETANLSSLKEEAVGLELNLSKLYMLFSAQFPEDEEFWHDLAIEEKNHATLIRSTSELFETTDEYLADMLTVPLQGLKKANYRICRLVDQYTKGPPSRSTAFSVALGLEKSSGEAHYQNYISQKFGEGMQQLFKDLNEEDKDHADRIDAYMIEHNIEKIPIEGLK